MNKIKNITLTTFGIAVLALASVSGINIAAGFGKATATCADGSKVTCTGGVRCRARDSGTVPGYCKCTDEENNVVSSGECANQPME